MTCYMRHLDWLYEALDMERDRETAKQLDCAIREALGLAPGAQCPEVWSAVKSADAEDRGAFVQSVSERLS